MGIPHWKPPSNGDIFGWDIMGCSVMGYVMGYNGNIMGYNGNIMGYWKLDINQLGADSMLI